MYTTVTIVNNTVFVTVQTGARQLGTLNLHDSTVCVEGNRFLLTEFQPWGCWEHSSSESSSPMRPRTSLAPQKTTSQTHAQKFPISLSVFKPVTQTDVHPLWNVHLWVSESLSSRRSSLLQGLWCAALSLHAVVLEPCAMLHCPRAKRVTSPYVHQEIRSLQFNIPGRNSAPRISHESG